MSLPNVAARIRRSTIRAVRRKRAASRDTSIRSTIRGMSSVRPRHMCTMHSSAFWRRDPSPIVHGRIQSTSCARACTISGRSHGAKMAVTSHTVKRDEMVVTDMAQANSISTIARSVVASTESMERRGTHSFRRRSHKVCDSLRGSSVWARRIMRGKMGAGTASKSTKARSRRSG